MASVHNKCLMHKIWIFTQTVSVPQCLDETSKSNTSTRSTRTALSVLQLARLTRIDKMWFALCDLEAQAPTKWSNTTPHYYPNMRFDWKTKIVEPFFGASLFSVWVRDWHSVVRRVNFIKYGWMTKTTECRSLFQLRSDISGLGRWRLFLKLEIKCNSCPTHSLLWYPAQSFAFVAADTATLEATFVHFAINSCKTNLRCRSEECIKIWKIAPKICLLRKFANCYALKSNKVSVFGADKLHHWSQLTHFQMQKSKCNSLPRVPCYNTSGFKIQINKNTERRKTERQKDRHTEILLISKCKRASATPPGFEQTQKLTATHIPSFKWVANPWLETLFGEQSHWSTECTITFNVKTFCFFDQLAVCVGLDSYKSSFFFLEW